MTPARTAQKRTHQQDSDDLGNSQIDFRLTYLEEARQTNIDGEFSFALHAASPVVRNRSPTSLDHPVSPDETTASFAAIPRPKTFVFHNVSAAHPIICGGCENTIAGVGCGSHVPTPNTHSDLNAFLRDIMSTDLSAHRSLFLAQGFNM
ncbi:hypothetical protein B0H11DRAFT_2233275 [Mycena galericulata]|nr:hypothetical protein B0H11DRAFT_2233275 [Mycena galericulata]